MTDHTKALADALKAMRSKYGAYACATCDQADAALAAYRAAPSLTVGDEPETYPPCRGMNCGATDGKSHSPECFAEHTATVDPGVGERHREHRYAGYRGEPFPASATEDQQAAWVIGVKAGLRAQPAAQAGPATDIDEAALTRMTERGAVAWAGHEPDAQAEPVAWMLRDITQPCYEPWPTRVDSEAYRRAAKRSDFECRPLVYGDVFNPPAQLVGEPEAWHMVCGDWRDEAVAIHGPQGHIASGLTTEQARALIDAHGGRAALAQAQKEQA